MKMGFAALAAGVLACAPAGAAFAQSQHGASMVGVWNGEAPGQGGMVHGSDQYNADGSYVSVMQLPNGTVQRIWGSYTVQPVSAGEMRIDYRVQGFLPRQICAQAPGFQVNCRPNQVPPTSNMQVRFVSPSELEANGIALHRVSGSPLLQMQVPAQLVLAAQAPVQPNMRQPVMPTLHPYQTPTGPGSVQGMRQDDQMQQYRICAVNGGQVVKEYGGTVRCIH